MHIQVTGIGPLFKLSMRVQNTSSSLPSIDLCITFDYDNRLYAVRKPYIAVSLALVLLAKILRTDFFLCFIQCTGSKPEPMKVMAIGIKL